MSPSPYADLGGKVAVVTGGSRGLGREIALALARHGTKVVVASRKLPACEALAEEITASGGRALAHAFHAGRWDACQELADAAEQAFGGVDILVNNAGMSPLYDSLDGVTEELFDKVLAVNLKGPFRLSAIVGTRMAARKRGVIINVSSISAVQPRPGELPYAAAKAGLDALTKGLARAFAPHVRVNSIMPGAFLTDIAAAWDPDELREQMIPGIALRRAGLPEEIVGAALYLASDASSYTTGSILKVDGGAAFGGA